LTLIEKSIKRHEVVLFLVERLEKSRLPYFPEYLKKNAEFDPMKIV
jgi:hypothetical protein